MYSQPEGEGQPKKRPRKARPLSGNVDTIRASGTLGEALRRVHCACHCLVELSTGRFWSLHLILACGHAACFARLCDRNAIGHKPSRKHSDYPVCASKPSYVKIQRTSKPSCVNQHKLVAVVWRLQCKCVAVTCVQSVVRNVVTVAAV